MIQKIDCLNLQYCNNLSQKTKAKSINTLRNSMASKNNYKMQVKNYYPSELIDIIYF